MHAACSAALEAKSRIVANPPPTPLCDFDLIEELRPQLGSVRRHGERPRREFVRHAPLHGGRRSKDRQDARAIGFDCCFVGRLRVAIEPRPGDAFRRRNQDARQKPLVAQDRIDEEPRRRVWLNHEVHTNILVAFNFLPFGAPGRIGDFPIKNTCRFICCDGARVRSRTSSARRSSGGCDRITSGGVRRWRTGRQGP